MTLVVLATLASCAFFIAQGTTGLVAAAFLEVDRSVQVASGPGAGQTSKRVVKNDDEILRRNIFHGVPLDDGSMVEEVEETDGELTEEVATSTDDPDNAPPCEGSMRLMAAVANPRRAEWSFASIVGAAGKALLYRVGQSVDGHQVFRVDSQRVVLQTGAALCSLTMFAPPVAAGQRVAARPPTPATPPTAVAARPTRPAREGAITSEAMDSGISRVNDTTYNIQRSLVDDLLENQQELLRAARVIPHEDNGRVVGVKLYGIRRNSLLGRLGVQNGDMLRTINGYDMSSPDSALEAYTRLRTANHLTLNVVRRGQPTTLDYNIHQ